MSNLVKELNNLDFSVYIGGPFQEAVRASASASMAQVEFIEAVGFDTKEDAAGSKTKTLRYVDFEYKKKVPNPEYDPSKQGSEKYLEKDVAIKVPFLSMLTIPSLRIDEMTIDFNAKLTSVETSQISSHFAANASLGLNFKRVKFKASASYRRSSYRGTNVQKSYDLGVHVKAVNDEIPAGLDRIFTMLEESITGTTE